MIDDHSAAGCSGFLVNIGHKRARWMTTSNWKFGCTFGVGSDCDGQGRMQV